MHCLCFHILETHLKMSLRYRGGKSKPVSHQEKKIRGITWLLMTGLIRFLIFSDLEQTHVCGDRIELKTIEPKFPFASGKMQVLGCSKFFCFVLL